MGADKARIARGVDLGETLEAAGNFVEEWHALMGVEVVKRMATEGVTGSGHGGEGQGFEPGGAGLGVAGEEDVGGARLEVSLCVHGAHQEVLRHPNALVLSEAHRRHAFLEWKAGDEVVMELLVSRKAFLCVLHHLLLSEVRGQWRCCVTYSYRLWIWVLLSMVDYPVNCLLHREGTSFTSFDWIIEK